MTSLALLQLPLAVLGRRTRTTGTPSQPQGPPSRENRGRDRTGPAAAIQRGVEQPEPDSAARRAYPRLGTPWSLVVTVSAAPPVPWARPGLGPGKGGGDSRLGSFKLPAGRTRNFKLNVVNLITESDSVSLSRLRPPPPGRAGPGRAPRRSSPFRIFKFSSLS